MQEWIIALENLGVKVKAVGMGKLRHKSLAGQDIIKHNYNIISDYTKRHII
jgi:hypothetical protein